MILPNKSTLFRFCKDSLEKANCSHFVGVFVKIKSRKCKNSNENKVLRQMILFRNRRINICLLTKMSVARQILLFPKTIFLLQFFKCP